MNAPASVSKLSEKLDAAQRRKAKIVAAARVVSIDYAPIVADAVAALHPNTPDARRDVYAQARATVHRHLQLMRLPEPVVELEKLALDVTIRKIERQERLAQAALEPRHGQDSETATSPHVSLSEALRSLRTAFNSLGRALAPRLGRPSLRAIVPVVAILLYPLRLAARSLVSPVAIAALPIAAMAIFIVYFADNNDAYRNLTDSRIARWLAHPVPATDAPVAAKSPDRLRPGIDTDPAARAEAPVPPRSCGDLKSASDRIACAAQKWAQPPPDTTSPRAGFGGPPAWVSGYSDVVATASTRSAVVPATSAETPASSTSVGADAGEPPAAAAVQPIFTDAPPAPTAPPLMADATAAAPSPPPPGSAAGIAAMPAIALPDNAPPAPDPPTARIPAKPAPVANSRVAALIESGRRWVLKGDLDHAVRDFTEAVRVDPKYPDGYYERGQVLFKLGETERSIADYSSAIKRDPQNAAALRARGMSYLYRGSADLALADLSTAIEAAESDPDRLPLIELFYARRSRATLYGSKQQYDLEIEDCSTIIDGYLNDPAVADALKENYHEVGAANIMATVYRQRATAYIRQSKWELATADLTAAIPLSSDLGFSALLDRAKLREALGQRDQAVTDLQAALGIRPGSEEVRLGLRRLGAVPKPVIPRAM